MTCKRCHEKAATYCVCCLNTIMTLSDDAARTAEADASRYRTALQMLLKWHSATPTPTATTATSAENYIAQAIREVLEGEEIDGL